MKTIYSVEYDAENSKQLGPDESNIAGLVNIFAPGEIASEPSEDIGDILLVKNIISQEQLDGVRQKQSQTAKDVFDILLEDNIVKESKLYKVKAQILGLDYVELVSEEIQPDIMSLLDIDYIRSMLAIPLEIDGDKLLIGTANPEDVFLIDDIKRITKKDVAVAVCSRESILGVCDYLSQQEQAFSIDDIVSDLGDIEVVKDDIDESEDLEKIAGQSPVIKYVNYLINNARHENASDIHIEPKEKFTKIRYRIDGILYESMQVPAKMHSAVTSRLKIMSNLDISERRLPQDGKVAVKAGGRNIDLRVSILPTSHGEKVVIRILDSKSILRGLDNSGMSGQLRERFDRQIAMPNGIFLVTGPTGSGKSTTLYSALGKMDGNSLNISTVEDPVEYDLEFCNQIQVNDKIGMSFAAALRSLLRQDPDIIMVGEIRDSETAQIAVRAALTGHLVLSTLHTNDSTSSIARLVNIGIEPYLIGASLNAILAQRLVRRICDNCKDVCSPPDNIKRLLEDRGCHGQVYAGKGCDKCRGSGYAGRLGIFEFFEVDEHARELINGDPSNENIRKHFISSGNKSLFDDGIDKVHQGLTTIEEILRVTQI